MTNPHSSTQYFDLHTRGIGYLNRIREVKPKKGDSFWACSIAALRGDSDKAEYTTFDCRISGAEALKLVRRCIAAVDANKKVLIGFKIGDIYAETFVFEKGERKGQTGVSLKGRLLHISFIKVDGKEVYKAESKADSSETSESAESAQTPVETPITPNADKPADSEAKQESVSALDEPEFA